MGVFKKPKFCFVTDSPQKPTTANRQPASRLPPPTTNHQPPISQPPPTAYRHQSLKKERKRPSLHQQKRTFMGLLSASWSRHGQYTRQQQLAVGDGWRLLVGSCWRLAVGRESDHI
jgi:hypothetical protein